MQAACSIKNYRNTLDIMQQFILVLKFDWTKFQEYRYLVYIKRACVPCIIDHSMWLKGIDYKAQSSDELRLIKSQIIWCIDAQHLTVNIYLRFFFFSHYAFKNKGASLAFKVPCRIFNILWNLSITQKALYGEKSFFRLLKCHSH